MNEARLRKYANLIATVGANVQKGQRVAIYAELDQPAFVTMLAEECYKAGASKVSVNFNHQPLTALDVAFCSEETLGEVEPWFLKKWEYQAETLPAKIFLLSEDPDGLAGIDQAKYSKGLASRQKQIKPIRMKMENHYQWCIAAVAGSAWAKKLFPEMRERAAVEKLWRAILDTSRVTQNPVTAWKKHNRDLAKKCRILNNLGIESLHYTASNGTDLTVGLLADGTFCAGEEKTIEGCSFNPNIPSEEVFTSPKRGAAEGIVYSSMPLSYDGQLIDEFWLKFEGGKVVDLGAKKNEALLREIVSMDEGAPYLGECALVPYSSPIRKCGILFYNTLFDENAACHLALGMGFTNTLKDYEKYTEDECHARGINDSIVHEDFMIGTPDLSITAKTRDGKEIAIFKDGEWAL